MNMLLSGRTAVITGAAQGLGYAIAKVFISEGANVMIGDLDAAAATRAAQRLSSDGQAAGQACNVTIDGDVEELLASAVRTFGSVEIMVNNAGITRDATMRKMPTEDFQSVIDVHLRGTWLGTKAAASLMRGQGRGGSIINMSSISGKVGNPGQTNYSAAKAGIIGMTKAAAKEVGFAGIRVNALQPGLIETDMTQQLRPEVRASRLEEIPLGRFGQPEEVASVAVFLASDMASYLTGTTVEISGGRHV